MLNQPDDSDGEGEDEVVESGEDQKKVRKEDASRQADVVNHWVEIVAEDEVDDETRLAEHFFFKTFICIKDIEIHYFKSKIHDKGFVQHPVHIIDNRSHIVPWVYYFNSTKTSRY